MALRLLDVGGIASEVEPIEELLNRVYCEAGMSVAFLAPFARTTAVSDGTPKDLLAYFESSDLGTYCNAFSKNLMT